MWIFNRLVRWMIRCSLEWYGPDATFCVGALLGLSGYDWELLGIWVEEYYLEAG